jgi:DNA-binding Lrp family transcriptional regulator
MTPPIDFVHIDSDILQRQDLNCTEKMITGLVKSFNGKGLRLSNDKIATLLGIRADSVSRILTGLVRKNIISMTGAQSKYRKIYFGENAKVKDGVLRDKCQSKTVLLRHLCQDTSAFMPNIIKRTKRTTQSDNKKNTLFDSFWTAYPKKANKPAALKAFRKANPDEALLAAMLAALAAQKTSEQWQREDGRFIPYPATWLNGERWNDKNEVAAGGYIPNDPTESEADELLQKAGLL